MMKAMSFGKSRKLTIGRSFRIAERAGSYGRSGKRCEADGALMIDINFGCPAKKVVNKYAGSAIMQDETLARSIMQKIAKAVTIPVTVKMRTGWDADNRNAVQIARFAEDADLKMITVQAELGHKNFGHSRLAIY